jgi:hypothetical protein
MDGTDAQRVRYFALVAAKEAPMLCDSMVRLSEFDQRVYREVVPAGHYLRKVMQVVPWDDFQDLLAAYYTPCMGRPAESPVLTLKPECLRYHHKLWAYLGVGVR